MRPCYQFVTMHTVSNEFLMTPEESAECLSLQVVSGHETSSVVPTGQTPHSLCQEKGSSVTIPILGLASEAQNDQSNLQAAFIGIRQSKNKHFNCTAQSNVMRFIIQFVILHQELQSFKNALTFLQAQGSRLMSLRPFHREMGLHARCTIQVWSMSKEDRS